MISPQRRAEVIEALRRGTVPKAGLDALAVGYGRLQGTLDEELDAVAAGRGAFKAIRGEYGSGKTFFGRWLQERARTRSLATSEAPSSICGLGKQRQTAWLPRQGAQARDLLAIPYRRMSWRSFVLPSRKDRVSYCH